MESIYGPRPGQRRRTSDGRREPVVVPLWRRVVGALVLISVGVACFVALVALEVNNSGPDENLERLRRIQLNLRTPAFDLGALDTPAFKPLQSAIILPSSALRPADGTTAAEPKRYQTAELIP